MDALPPYISSGASSRAHYSLVRKVEYADSPQAANQFLLDEVNAIRQQLEGAPVTLEENRKCLITLLYCYISASDGFLPINSFDFALSHAVTLAEAGRTISQKRIGYLFCAEVMPVEHELRLMLVNTLRKDLEHEDIPIICLALENVVGSWNEDLVPAIQTDLYDLLSHNSPHIRRRALHAYRSLSVQHKDLLSNIGQKVSSKCKDPDVEVAIAAVALCKYMVEIEYPVPHAQEVINDLLITLTNAASYHPNFICTILPALGSVGLFDTTIPSVLNLIRSSSDRREYEILLGAFNVIGKVAPERLLSAEPKSPVHHIRSLLISHNPNDVYLFLTCLEYLDPVLWAGTSTDIPSVLDGWEVERIMQLLDGPDQLIRKKTLGLLHRVDLNIVSACYSQVVQSIPRGLSIADLNERVTRIHEILVVMADQDGEFYAKELLELTSRLEQGSLEGQIVLEVLVEAVLTHSRHRGVDFEIGSSTRLLSSLVDSKMVLSQTILVVMAALAVEQCGKLSIRPLDILEGFAARLQNSIPSVREASLLAMLRVAADCDEIPSSIVESIASLGHRSKPHIRQRCEQFVTLVADRPHLTQIVQNARSSSLPHFVVELSEPSRRTPLTRLSSSQSLSASKLRYDAYEAPTLVPKLRNKRNASLSGHVAGRTDDGRDTLSVVAPESMSRISSKLSVSSESSSSRPLSPGELTLAASQGELEMISKNMTRSKEFPIENLVSRVDLISLDSPFTSEPLERSKSSDQTEFEGLWVLMEGGDARGWFSGTVSVAVERIESMKQVRLKIIHADLPPYEGDMKMIVFDQGDRAQAVLRMKESEEDSCLWRLRCMEKVLSEEIRGQLVVDGS